MSFRRLALRVVGPAVLVLAASGKDATPSGASNPCSLTSSELCFLIEAGRLNDLRWPNFLDYRAQVRAFYLPFDYRLAWIAGNGPTPQARAIIHRLQGAEKKGLRAEDYDGPMWKDRVARLTPPAPQPSASDLARFDLALTVSVMRYLSAVHDGRTNPSRPKFSLEIERRRYTLAEFLRERVMQAQDVESALAQAEPSYAGYGRELAALDRYQRLAQEGEGDPLPAFKETVKPGDPYTGVRPLMQRLQRLGDLPQGQTGSDANDVYEGELVEAIKRFQQRHGLPADGIIGRATFNQLTVPFDRRIAQLQLALERWRWLPSRLPQRFIVVNVPEFMLRAYDDHQRSLSMRVVVGKAFRENQTPVFQHPMEYLIFRPYWNVPASITRKELIPAIENAPAYLEKHDFEVVDRKQKVVDADVTDTAFLDSLRSGDLAIRQKPGPGNSMGLIKFVFPNDYDVYLHGTPQKALFAHSRRAFSHGCIRIEDPAALAAWALQGDPSWTTDRIQAAMDGEDSVRVNLPDPIPVLVLYGTALVDEDGKVHFFEDIYGQDRKLQRALATQYPYPH